MMTWRSWLAVTTLLSVPILAASQATPSQESIQSDRRSFGGDYRIGAEDLLGITVLEAPELSRAVRVSSGGEISLPLVGVLSVTGLTTREVELKLEERLFATYMVDPHVSVQVDEVASHSVSVVGAVRRPGTFQIRGARTLLEVLSLAEGMADNAGDTVTIVRRSPLSGDVEPGQISAGTDVTPVRPLNADATSTTGPLGSAPAETIIEVRIQDLLGSNDPRHNVQVLPGDTIKVNEAGMIYIVGEVNRPGAFPLREHGEVTLLRALALGEGLKATAAKEGALIVRSQKNGQREEIAVNLRKVLEGKAPDPSLEAQDIVFVPNSAGKTFARGTLDALIRMVVLRPLVF